MIDELDAVRRLGAADAAPDPDARERVRARVVAGPRRRRPRWPFALVPAGAVALGVALLVALGGDGAPRNFASPATTPAPSTERAAELFPAPDQYYYVRSRGQYLSCRADEQPSCTLPEPTIREVWMSERRESVLNDGRDPATANAKLGRLRLRIGNHAFTHAELAAYDPTPRELLDMLVRERPPGQGGDTPSYPYVQITDALREMPSPPRVRKALIEALPLVPGVKALGEVTDSEGRKGLGYAVEDHGMLQHVIVDPRSLLMLEEYDTLLDPAAAPGAKAQVGDVVGRGTYLEWGVTDEVIR